MCKTRIKAGTTDYSDEDYWEKYSSHWKFAMFIEILHLFSQLEIKNIDVERLVIDVDLLDTERKAVFKHLPGLLAKLCLVNVKIKRIPNGSYSVSLH